MKWMFSAVCLAVIFLTPGPIEACERSTFGWASASIHPGVKVTVELRMQAVHDQAFQLGIRGPRRIQFMIEEGRRLKRNFDEIALPVINRRFADSKEMQGDYSMGMIFIPVDSLDEAVEWKEFFQNEFIPEHPDLIERVGIYDEARPNRFRSVYFH